MILFMQPFSFYRGTSGEEGVVELLRGKLAVVHMKMDRLRQNWNMHTKDVPRFVIFTVKYKSCVFPEYKSLPHRIHIK